MTQLGDAINRQIQAAEASNGRSSPLHGLGEWFVAYQDQYGVNAAVVCAISMRECQLGAASGDAIVPYNNFGGNTCGAVGITTASGCVTTAGRRWDTFPTAKAGLEAIFQTLNAPLYRATDGSLDAIMRIYSPPSENDYNDLWRIFGRVGSGLGVALGPTTRVYTKAAPSSDAQRKACEQRCEQQFKNDLSGGYITCIQECVTPGATTDFAQGLPFDTLTKAIAQAGERAPFFLGGLVVLGIGLWRVVTSG